MTYDLFGLVQKFSIHKIEAEFVVVVFLFYFFIVCLVLLLLCFFQDNGTVASENEDKHTWHRKHYEQAVFFRGLNTRSLDTTTTIP